MWKDITLICIVALGLVLFLYGANFYAVIVGWIGVYLIVGGILLKILSSVWEIVKKDEPGDTT